MVSDLLYDTDGNTEYKHERDLKFASASIYNGMHSLSVVGDLLWVTYGIGMSSGGRHSELRLFSEMRVDI